MPAKIQLDENLWFLYICHTNSDFKTGPSKIDFNAVGEKAGLKAPAARMRYTRLRSKIENGTLIGTQGTPFVAGPKEKSPKVSSPKKKKRKAVATGGGQGSSVGKVANATEEDDVEKLDELGPVLDMRTRGKRVKVKLEDEDGELGYMSSGGSSEYGDAGDGDLDTDDDIDDLPLVQNKKSLLHKKKNMVTDNKPTPKTVAEKDGEGGLSVLQPATPAQAVKEVQAMQSKPPIPEQQHLQQTARHHQESAEQFQEAVTQMPAETIITLPANSEVQPPVSSLQNCSISSPNRQAAQQSHEPLKTENKTGSV